MALSLCVFSFAAFAGEEKEGVKFTKSANIKSKIVECTPSSTKVFHHVNNCGHFSWFTVDYVETTIVTCVNGVAVTNCYHWDQNPSLVCS